MWAVQFSGCRFHTRAWLPQEEIWRTLFLSWEAISQWHTKGGKSQESTVLLHGRPNTILFTGHCRTWPVGPGRGLVVGPQVYKRTKHFLWNREQQGLLHLNRTTACVVRMDLLKNVFWSFPPTTEGKTKSHGLRAVSPELASAGKIPITLSPLSLNMWEETSARKDPFLDITEHCHTPTGWVCQLLGTR